MKLVGFKTQGKTKTGLIENQKITEINSSMIEAINTLNVDELELLNTYKLQEVEILAPISPSKIVCIGLNYTDHAKELDMDHP